MDAGVLRALVRLASLVTGTTGASQLIEAVAETALELLLAESLSISQVQPGGHTLATVINVGDLGPGERRWPTDEFYRVADFPDTEAALFGNPKRRSVTRLDDPDADPAEAALLRSLGKFSSIANPILVDGVMWGELWASRSSRVAPFDSYDADLAEVIVGLVSAGLAQASAWQAMEDLASTDAMTGLANRRAFDAHLAAAAHRAGVDRTPLSLALGDVNGLKVVNDTRGHEAGDDALVHAARAASDAVAGIPHALAARLGGDEFALVLPGLDAPASMQVARVWCQAVRHNGYGVTLACGIAVAAADATSLDPRDLLRAADDAQYAAKRGNSRHPLLARPA